MNNSNNKPIDKVREHIEEISKLLNGEQSGVVIGFTVTIQTEKHKSTLSIGEISAPAVKQKNSGIVS